jgi:hypothetical protein
MKRNNFWHNVPRNVPDPSGVTPAPTPDPAPAPAGPDLSFIPTNFHKDGAPDLAAFTAHYQEVIARDAQRAERDAAIPETYEFGLPEGFKFEGIDGLPADFKVELDPTDPTLKPLYDEFGGLLKEIGAPAEAGKKLLGVLARYEATQYAEAVKAIEADLGKLGARPQVEARVAVIERALETRLPADEAAALKAALRNSGAIKAMERLLGPARGSTPPPSTPPGSSDENLSPAQRLERANLRALSGAR